jgi:hypothetical protein
MLALDGTDLPRDKDALEDALLFIERMTDPKTGRTGYTKDRHRPPREVGRDQLWPDNQSESMTAAGVLCRMLADPKRRRPGNAKAIKQGLALVERLPPVWSKDKSGRVDYYYWYFGTRAMALKGGRSWEGWREGLEDAILSRGLEPGDAIGSWDPALDPWGHIGGRVYSTAMMTMAALAAESAD